MTAHPDTRPLVLGRYRIDGLVGRGGASQVHRAYDVQTGQDVALKEIPLGAEMARRAGAEVKAACRLAHPGIVRLLDFGEDANSCYLISELVTGASLAELTRDGWVAERPDAVVTVMADVLDGLAHAHGRGVTHRDVKPANILVDRSGRGRLADFGIARIAGEAGLTTVGGLVGTVSYMSPEQARGEETGPASDVYSACVVLYEALTGQNPLVGASPGETLRRAADGAIPRLAQARPDLPSALSRAIDDGLDPNPDRRPAPGWLAQTLRAQIRVLNGLPRPAPGLAARLPILLRAAAAAITTTAALGHLAEMRPAIVAASAAGAAMAYAFAAWPATLLTLVAGIVALAMHAPGLAMIVGSIGLVVVLTARRRARLVPLAAIAPVTAALGLGPAFALAAGLVRGWRSRLWVAATGLGAALTWQVVAGADPGLDGGRVIGVWERTRGELSPIAALEALAEPVRTRPALAVATGLLCVAALAVPLLQRLPRGAPRGLGVATWLVALVIGVRAFGGSVESAIGAFLPGGILVAVWAAAPWRRLARRADRQETVTLRHATVERLPAG